MARCSLFELNETREESERESFLLKIFLGKSPRKSSFHPVSLILQCISRNSGLHTMDTMKLYIL